MRKYLLVILAIIAGTIMSENSGSRVRRQRQWRQNINTQGCLYTRRMNQLSGAIQDLDQSQKSGRALSMGHFELLRNLFVIYERKRRRWPKLCIDRAETHGRHGYYRLTPITRRSPVARLSSWKA